MSNRMHSARRLPTPGWVKWSAIFAVSPGLRTFTDSLITGQPWRGQQRRTRMVVYRWLGKSRDPMPPVAMLNQVCDRVVNALGGAGIRCTRQNGLQVHGWLLRLFNPSPDWVEKPRSIGRLLTQTRARHQKAPCRSAMILPKPCGSRRRFQTRKTACGGLTTNPHCAVAVEKLRTPPEPGTPTGEKSQGEKKLMP